MRRTGRTRRPGQGPALSELEQIRLAHGPEAAARKRELLAALGRGRFASAKALVRFHELLCFFQAFPDDAATLALVDRAPRPLLRPGRPPALPARARGHRHRRDRPRPSLLLSDGPLARAAVGSAPHDRLERVREERTISSGSSRSSPSSRRRRASTRSTSAPAAGRSASPEPGETDAAFLVRRVDALPFDAFWKEYLYESLEMPLRLAPGPTTPSRTLARVAGAAPVFPRGPLVRSRPDIPREVARPPLSLRTVTGAAARRLLDAARASMVTRQRDLDIFEYASEADVRLADVRRRSLLRRDRRDSRAAPSSRGRLRVPDAEERRPRRLRPRERPLRLVGDRLQRLRVVPGRGGRPHLRPRPVGHARPLRVRHLHDLPVPARRREPRGDRVRRLVVLPEVRLRAEGARRPSP